MRVKSCLTISMLIAVPLVSQLSSSHPPFFLTSHLSTSDAWFLPLGPLSPLGQIYSTRRTLNPRSSALLKTWTSPPIASQIPSSPLTLPRPRSTPNLPQTLTHLLLLNPLNLLSYFGARGNQETILSNLPTRHPGLYICPMRLNSRVGVR